MASQALVDRFVEQEFGRIDVDGSGTICLAEFTAYVTQMTRWMRDELMHTANAKVVFSSLVARAVEEATPMVSIPRTQGGSVAVQRYGVRVEVPPHALGDGAADSAQLALYMLSTQRVEYLAEGEKKLHGRRRGEFPFSPVVRIDFPAAAPSGAGSALSLVPPPNTASEGRFAQPLTLVMPHAYCPEDGAESVVMLGAAHGSDRWEDLALLNYGGGSVVQAAVIEGGEMRVSVPFAGIFCAFSSPDVEDICQVRFFVFALPEVPRDAPTTIRVHLCPELPDQVAEMRVQEECEWGLTEVVGRSEVISLYQGAKFELKFGGQVREMIWHGSRISDYFTFLPPASGEQKDAAGRGEPMAAGRQPNDRTMDRHASMPAVHKQCSGSRSEGEGRSALRCAAITLNVLEGEGRRGGRKAGVAKRAGIPATGYQLPFKLRARVQTRPLPPLDVTVAERTQWDFVLTWRAPGPRPGEEPHQITHYALELSVTGSKGTVRTRRGDVQRLHATELPPPAVLRVLDRHVDTAPLVSREYPPPAPHHYPPPPMPRPSGLAVERAHCAAHLSVPRPLAVRSVHADLAGRGRRAAERPETGGRDGRGLQGRRPPPIRRRQVGAGRAVEESEGRRRARVVGGAGSRRHRGGGGCRHQGAGCDARRVHATGACA